MRSLIRNPTLKFYLFIYLLFPHNKDYTSITLYKDVARGPQKTTRLVRGGPLVTIILSNRTITTHNNGQYKTHYRYSRKSKTFVLNDCNVKIEVTEFGKEFQMFVSRDCGGGRLSNVNCVRFNISTIILVMTNGIRG